MGDNPYQDGRHAIKNAINCLLAIRNAVDNGHITLVGGGEQPGNYAHVCDAIRWLQQHPQHPQAERAGPPTPRPIAGTMPAHDSPPVTLVMPSRPVPTDADGKPIEMVSGVDYFRINTDDQAQFIFEWWNDASGWTWVPHSAMPQRALALMHRCYTLADALATWNTWSNVRGDHVRLVSSTCNPMTPPSIPLLDGEDPATVAEMITGAFRIICINPTTTIRKPEPFKYVVERYRAFEQNWSGNLFDCSVDLWPWRMFDSIEDAEKAILAHGRAAGEPVTLVRNNGAEIVTAHPGYLFPRSRTGVKVLKNYVTPVIPISDTSVPEPDHRPAFRIFPNVLKPDDGWSIRQWNDTTGKWGTVTSFGTFPTYWDATDRLNRYAIEVDTPVFLITPRDYEITYWAENGFTIAAPSSPTPDTPVIIATPEQAQDILRDVMTGAATELGVTTPAPEVGTKIPVPLPDGYWAVDEWTAIGWNRIADELDWDTVEEKLRPVDAAPAGPTHPIGYCEIRESGEPGLATWNVFQWTGRAWKEIAGNVTRRTAEGVIRARALDPENPVATPLAGTIVKSYRRVVKGVRNDLVNIRTDLSDYIIRKSHPLTAEDKLNEIKERLEQVIKSIEDGISVHP